MIFLCSYMFILHSQCGCKKIDFRAKSIINFFPSLSVPSLFPFLSSSPPFPLSPSPLPLSLSSPLLPSLSLSLSCLFHLSSVTKCHYLSNVDHITPALRTLLELQFHKVERWVVRRLRSAIWEAEIAMKQANTARRMEGKRV